MAFFLELCFNETAEEKPPPKAKDTEGALLGVLQSCLLHNKDVNLTSQCIYSKKPCLLILSKKCRS